LSDRTSSLYLVRQKLMFPLGRGDYNVTMMLRLLVCRQP